MLNYIIWNVDPEIFSGLHIRWYGLFFAIGFFISYLCIKKIFIRENLTANDADNLTFTTFFLLLIGLRLGHCIFYEPDVYFGPYLKLFKSDCTFVTGLEAFPDMGCTVTWHDLARWLMVWEGGLASHGGAIGLVCAFIWFSRKSGKSFMWVMSRAAVVIPFTAFFVRMGNLMNSEIYGVATTLPWGFVFVRDAAIQTNAAELSNIMAQAGLVASESVESLQAFLSNCLPLQAASFESLLDVLLKYHFLNAEQVNPFIDACVQAGLLTTNHPTQIYEALTYLTLGGILVAYYQLRTKHNKPVSDYVISAIAFFMFFATRFFVEFIKNNQVEFEQNMTLDMGQLLSLPFILFGFVWVVLAIREKRKANQTNV
ncbi:MAG: prolipoprotein diacylglyceryl transferase [Bacteroidales bacterium]|nr:prolipoprotein diacylglyceryl transferase [Bacteroidales bacterium]